MDLLKIGLTSETATPMEMRTLADWQLKPLLLAVPGVADVSVVGGEVEQMQIKVDPQRLLEFQITLADIIKAAGEATGIRGAGYIETSNQRLLVAAEGQFSDPAVLGATVIKGSGGDAVRLRDVAEISKAASPKFGDALIQGKPGVLLAMTSQYATNTLDVTRRVEAALEKAALRFANGDDGGAQACLTAVLASDGFTAGDPRPGLALLDLFRLTGQQALFDAALPVHRQRFAGAPPSWFSVPAGLLAPPAHVCAATWVCPARLTADDVVGLQAALASAVAPWGLDWDPLEAIASDAVAPLQAVFAQWCETPLSLSFYGTAALEVAMRALTPSADANSPLTGWQLRLTALRLLGQRDEFELAALDACITHAIAPRHWSVARCQINRLVDADRLTPGVAVLPLGSDPASSGAAPALRGELRGDRPATLHALVPAPAGSGVLVVSCADLMRVDFSAAGRLLTWVSACREAGRQVRFDDVPHLVAAFFHVIGIHEHAQVVVRSR
jgi:ABC-type transporter Mla MlaB component